MKNINKYVPNRINDWIIDCDICGSPCWYSDSTKLSVDTGRGGCLVCPRDADHIDYGLVPYKIPGERPVKETRVNSFNETTNIFGVTPFDYSNNPMSADSTTPVGSDVDWEDADSFWELYNTNWEDM